MRSNRQQVVVAFDVDETLWREEYRDGELVKDVPVPETIALLRALAAFERVTIVVWSGGGDWYAEQAVRRLGLEEFVDRCEAKDLRKADVYDVCIDDADITLGKVNLVI